jgi:virginiamycin B lyase
VGTLKRTFSLSLVLVATLLLLAPAFAYAADPTITEFPVTSGSGPHGITTGSDGNLWFSEDYHDKIGKLTTSGILTEYTGITSGSNPGPITAGSDSNLWFSEKNSNKIGKISTGGTISEFVIPTLNSQPDGITAGPDGNLWFSESIGNKIGKITTGGIITEYPITTPSSTPAGITAGSDGNLWFSESNSNKIGKITTNGTVTEYAIPTASSVPIGIATGSNGSLWFSEQNGNKIGAITTDGIFSEYIIPSPSSSPAGITAGPDGNMWFVETNSNKIGRISTSGALDEFIVPSLSASVNSIKAGPDGNMWFSEQGTSRIGKVTLTSDWDNDGITNSIEDGAPNNGDANGDGTADSKQSNVTSFINGVTGNYASLQSNCARNNSAVISSTSANSSPDNAYSYPLGFMNFSLSCSVGATATVSLYFYTSLSPSGLVLRKYNSVTKTYLNIPGASVSPIVIGGQSAIKVVYQVTDGSSLDQDGLLNGIIVDPVGLGSTTVNAPNTGFGADLKPPVMAITILSLLSVGTIITGVRLQRNANHSVL